MNRPPWVERLDDLPDTTTYLESERWVAGAISTMRPFNRYHPAWALPIARRALDALSEWQPTE